MNVNPATSKHVHEHQGRKFYFCCAHCVEKFKSDPKQYLDTPRPSGLVTLGMPKASPSANAERDPVCGMNVNPATAKSRPNRPNRNTTFAAHIVSQKFQSAPDNFSEQS